MVGERECLYNRLVEEIRRKFMKSNNSHLCSLRMEILMAVHDLNVDYAIKIDPCHDFAWCLDACVRDKHLDAQQTSKLKMLLDSSRKELSKAMGDLAMISRDPHIVHFLCSMAVKILRDTASAGTHLPREHLALHLILKLLAFGSRAMEILNDDFPSQLVSAECVTRFLPAFSILIAENLVKFELQKATDEVFDEFNADNDLSADESLMEVIVEFLRSDEICALLWFHYLVEVMPSKRRFLQRGALFRYIQYLPDLVNKIGSRDPWIHLFIHRLIQTNVFDALISDDLISEKIISNLLIDALKAQHNAKFHLLRLCAHLKSSISDEQLEESRDALIKAYDEINFRRNSSAVLEQEQRQAAESSAEGAVDEKTLQDATRKWDDFFVQEFDKHKTAITTANLASFVGKDLTASAGMSEEDYVDVRYL